MGLSGHGIQTYESSVQSRGALYMRFTRKSPCSIFSLGLGELPNEKMS